MVKLKIKNTIGSKSSKYNPIKENIIDNNIWIISNNKKKIIILVFTMKKLNKNRKIR